MTDLHPVLNRTILDRPELRRAYETDAEVRGDVQLLGRFVGALASLVRVDVIEALLRDPEVLPSEADFRRRHYERTRYERALELGATAPVRVKPPPCPECAAGKCQNCTGESMVLGMMVTCPCEHDGSGFLVGPVKVTARYCKRCDFYTDHVSTAHDGLADRGLLLSREDARAKVQS